MKWWLAVLSIVVTIVALRWTAQHLDNEGLPEAIRRARGLHVLNTHWARIDNWRSDKALTACIWSAERTWPIVGGYQVNCELSQQTSLHFDVSRDFQSVTAVDEATKAALHSVEKWAKKRQRWP
jgi:hypothetical protein